MDYIKLLGLVAGTITSVTFLPQVIHIYKTKSAKDLSSTMLGMLIVGVAMWLAYGIAINDIAIMYTNGMVLFLSLIMLYFKFRFKENSPQ